jgi:hypothetical protein
MKNPSKKSYAVELTQTPGNGAPWTVRVFKKTLLGRKRMSSDWFLDGEQAKRFAGQIEQKISEDSDMNGLLARKPGWVLQRPPR